MKNILLLPLIAVFLFSCEEKENQTLKELNDTKKSLTERYKEITDSIATIEAEIAKLDTTKKPFAVTVDSITIAPFSHYFDVQGKVETEKNALLYPEMAGNVISINVSEGQKVSKGQVLIKLDTELIERSIEEVKTNYTLAKTVFEKQERLWSQNIGSEIQFLEAQTNKKSLENKLSTLRRQLAMATVRAPFSGIVDEIMPNVGEMASPQMPVARVMNLDKVFVTAEVSEDNLDKIAKGTSVIVDVAGESIPSNVSRIGNYINPSNRTFEIKVNVPNNSNRLKPNLIAKITIKDYSNEKAIVLPSSVIQQTISGQAFVYLLDSSEDDFTVVKKEIQAGRSYKNMTEVLSGLELGDVIIIDGGKSVQDGQKVIISQPKLIKNL